MKKGITFISILIAFFVLSVGLVTILRVFPVIKNLSEVSRTNLELSLVSENILTLVEQVYSSQNGPEVPAYLRGKDQQYPRYEYFITFEEEKAFLYDVHLTINWKSEGFVESRDFYGKFRRK